MDDPIQEIPQIILNLTTGSPSIQQSTLLTYFTPTANFKHPFCAVHNNRQAILRIFQWYKIMSPRIKIDIQSIAFDEKNLLLYVTMSQLFSIALVPLHSSPVTLTTVLQLSHGHALNEQQSPASALDKPAKYYITSQNDLYQVDQFVRFVVQPWWFGVMVIGLWHWLATMACIFGAVLGAPVTRWMERRWREEGGKGRTGLKMVAGEGINGVGSERRVEVKDD